MRAVFILVAGVLATTTANAGSLLPQDTMFTEASDAKDLNLPSFSDNSQADALSFNSVGQKGTVQIFDLGGKSGDLPGNGDFLEGLKMDLGQPASDDQKPAEPAQ